MVLRGVDTDDTATVAVIDMICSFSPCHWNSKFEKCLLPLRPLSQIFSTNVTYLVRRQSRESTPVSRTLVCFFGDSWSETLRKNNRNYQDCWHNHGHLPIINYLLLLLLNIIVFPLFVVRYVRYGNCCWLKLSFAKKLYVLWWFNSHFQIQHAKQQGAQITQKRFSWLARDVVVQNVTKKYTLLFYNTYHIRV